MVFPVHADVVITMGTQYLEDDSAEKERSHRRLADYSIQELIRIQDLAVRPGRGGGVSSFLPSGGALHLCPILPRWDTV